MEWLAVCAGLALYRRGRRRQGLAGLTSPGAFSTVIGCLVGAALGNKAAFALQDPALLAGHATEWRTWLAGQSLVGALLGGWLGVELAKRIAGISARTGDDYVLPLLVGIAIGRIGCFLAGLHDGTCGLPTSMPWGVDFGDGIPRHPTQLYESVTTAVAAATWSRWRTVFAATPGLAFRACMLGYLVWRVAIDHLKPVPYSYAPGLSGIQCLAIAGTLAIVVSLSIDARRTSSCNNPA